MSQTETVKMFRATEPLMVGTARAHNTGDLISQAQVEAGDWKDQVEAADAVQVVDPDAAPARTASQTDWVTYASAQARGDQRISIEEARTMKRDDLADRFLGPKA